MKLRIRQLLVAVLIMGIVAGIASALVPKDRPLNFALVCYVMIGASVTFLFVLQRLSLPIIQEMWRFYREPKKPSARTTFLRILLLVPCFYVGIFVLWLNLAVAVFVPCLPIIIALLLGWL